MILCKIDYTEPLTDLTGVEFDRLLVVGLKEPGAYNPPDIWLCHCRCRSLSLPLLFTGDELRAGKRRSCGCDG